MGMSNFFKKMLLGRAFSADDGTISFLGKFKVVMYESRAFSLTIQEIYKSSNDKKTYELFHEAGRIAVNQVRDALGKMPIERIVTSFLGPLTEVYGWGMVDIKKFKLDEKSLSGEVHVRKSSIVEYSLKDYGKDAKAFLFYKGLLSGMATGIAGFRCDAVESESVFHHGSGECVIIIRGEKNASKSNTRKR